MPSVFDIARQRKNESEELPQEEKDQEPLPSEIKEEVVEPHTAIFKKAQEKKNESDKKKIEKPNSSQQKFPLESEEDLEKDIDRNVARGLSRVGETIAGFPGDIESFIRSFLPEGQEKRTLPTSSELQGKAEKLGQGYLSPKNEQEKAGDDLVKDVASFMLPESGRASFFRNIGIPVAGLAAKEGSKHLNASEGTQTAAKLGTMFLLDLYDTRRTMGMGGARNFLNHVREESERMVPRGTTTHIPGLQRAVQIAIQGLEEGGTSPSKATILQQLREFENVIHNDRVGVRELIQRRKGINEYIDSKGGFEFFKQPSHIQDASVRHLNNFKRLVISGLDHYSQSNPQFGAWNRAFNEGYAAFAGSNYFTNFMKKNFGDKITNGTVKALMTLGPIGGAVGMKFAPLLTGLSATTIPIYQAVKLVQRMYNSPTLRNYYNNIFRHAFQGNVPAVASNVKSLEKEFDKLEKQKEKKIAELKSRASHQRKKSNKSSSQRKE